MKRYAIKVIKGKEFLQSKTDVIDLGSKSLETHKKVINILNDKKPLNNLKENECYFLVNESDTCFIASYYATFKVIYGKHNVRLQRTAF
jgi:hypothetical protein